MKIARQTSRGLIALTAVTGWLFSLLNAAAQNATLDADYQLQQVYTDSNGNLGPLTEVGTPYLEFVAATVNGQSQYVLQVDASDSGTGTPVVYPVGGVATPANPFTDGSSYSVVLLASFNINPANVVATKVFDFSNLTSDAGLYINDTTGALQFINGSGTVIAGGTGLNVVPATTYFYLTLTRTAAGVVTAYVNGTQDFQFTDSTNLAVLGSGEMLSLFANDNSGTGGSAVDEATIGDIARLQLYNGALTSAQVAALVPEPSTWVLLLGAIACFGPVLHRIHRMA